MIYGVILGASLFGSSLYAAAKPTVEPDLGIAGKIWLCLGSLIYLPATKLVVEKKAWHEQWPEHEVKVEPTTTVLDIKKQLAQKLNSTPDQLDLQLQCKDVGGSSLKSTSLADEDVIYLHYAHPLFVKIFLIRKDVAETVDGVPGTIKKIFKK